MALIPPAVWNEVTVQGAGAPGAGEVSRAAWIKVEAPEPMAAGALAILVDRGEAEAIALALMFPGCLFLADDSRARRVAATLGVRQTGTVGLLKRAKQHGFIQAVRPHIEALEANGIYIRKTLIEAVLREVGE